MMAGPVFDRGQIEGEAGALAFAALDVEAAAHGEDKRARLIGADAEPRFLGRDEGLEQAVADEGWRHARAAVDHLDGDVAAALEEAQFDGLVAAARLDRILDEV